MAAISDDIIVPADMTGLTDDERNQLLEVMHRAKEFEAQEEKHLMRQPIEGLLYKYTNVVKGFQYRWFVLNPDIGRLEYYEKEEYRKQRPRGSVYLAGSTICPSDEDSQTFLVNVADGDVYRLRAIDAKERQLWVNRLRATAEYHTASMAPNVLTTQEIQLSAPYTQPQARGGRAKSGSVENIPHCASPTGSESARARQRGRTMTDVSRPKTVVVPHVTRDFIPVSVKSASLGMASVQCTTQADPFSSVHETLARVKQQRNTIAKEIESLPLSGDKISCIDEELLLLKATSMATLGCLEDCLSILQQQSSCKAFSSPGNATWFRPVPISCTASNLFSSSPTESFVSVSSSLQDDEAGGSIEHSTEVEDSHEYIDTDLGGVEEHKSIILHLLTQLKRGMDLTKVVLPTFILEKRSLLELFADCMAHPDLFVSIPAQPDSEKRMLAVLEWYLTSFHVSRKGSIAKKPYNPVIGETFRCSWKAPVADTTTAMATAATTLPPSCHGDDGVMNGTGGDQTAADGRPDESPEEEDGERGRRANLFYCAEQVSHHPPISAFYCECPDKSMYLNASIWTKSQFMGMSIGVMMVGKLKLHLLSHGEEYEFSLPSAYARSILTVPWVELGDRVNIHCRHSGYSASVVFHTKPFYGGKLHKISSEVRNPNGEVICKVIGEWNGVLEFIYANGETKQIDTSCLETIRKCVRPLAAQGSFESRRLWQHVGEKLRRGDIDAATLDKRFLEERQRQGERHRKDNGITFPTRYFHKDGDGWVYNKLLRLDQLETSI